jgi:hypothetical protein
MLMRNWHLIGGVMRSSRPLAARKIDTEPRWASPSGSRAILPSSHAAGFLTHSMPEVARTDHSCH